MNDIYRGLDGCVIITCSNFYVIGIDCATYRGGKKGGNLIDKNNEENGSKNAALRHSTIQSKNIRQTIIDTYAKRSIRCKRNKSTQERTGNTTIQEFLFENRSTDSIECFAKVEVNRGTVVSSIQRLVLQNKRREQCSSTGTFREKTVLRGREEAFL